MVDKAVPTHLALTIGELVQGNDPPRTDVLENIEQFGLSRS